MVGRRRITDDADGFTLSLLLALLVQHGDNSAESIPVAIETPRGLLVAQDRGFCGGSLARTTTRAKNRRDTGLTLPLGQGSSMCMNALQHRASQCGGRSDHLEVVPGESGTANGTSHDVLSEFVGAAATKFGIPGVSVGVWADGRGIYAYHGVTSLDNPLPVDQETLYLLGPVTKTYTATTLMPSTSALRPRAGGEGADCGI